ncbi:hypothetical protein ILP92_18180 [Maribius pontilimi]|uniref:Uncharacterized protein n=1 Tax=Palleronia pontilimi TaxID=1964209 RepID=A0A934MIX2_9RHOB|nr:hypothetical protein [Palleronia pontilimi]
MNPDLGFVDLDLSNDGAEVCTPKRRIVLRERMLHKFIELGDHPCSDPFVRHELLSSLLRRLLCDVALGP